MGYEVYIRSFADANGDGNGDLDGLHDRLEHLAWLGIDVVWITPFYPSPRFDMGYDVANYCDVDPIYGDLDAFDRVVARARELGLRVMVDLVPNHTSHVHPWFEDSRTSRSSARRNWYVWRDPAPDGGPPNNWVQHFGGPAWTWDETTGQYYLHLFLPEQPDLNWDEPAVRDRFDEILRFWLDRGVSGFRIDVAHSLVKDARLPDNPQLRPVTPDMSPGEVHDSFEHLYDVDQPGVIEVYRRWRTIVDSYDALLLGEVYLRDPAKVRRYVASGDALHTAFNFDLMHMPWEVDAVRRTLRSLTDNAVGGTAVAISSHDRKRAPTRFGGGPEGTRRALALLVLTLGLPELTFLYQGDELGLGDIDVPDDLADDPAGVRNENKSDSRDGCRTPIPWSPEGPAMGFSTSERTWLPLGERKPDDTVAIQRDDPGSHLHRVRELIAARRHRTDLHLDGPAAQWMEASDHIVAYRRGATIVAANLSDQPAELHLPSPDWAVAYSTLGDGRPPGSATIVLEDLEAVICDLETETD